MNVLVMTGRFGMGHFSAASTLAQEIKKENPNATITMVDLFEELIPKHYETFYNGYTKLVSVAGGVYNLYYRMTECSRKNVRPPMMSVLFGLLEGLLARIRPDVIVSTLPICSQLISQYKIRKGFVIPLVTCVTDISAHNEWVNDATDYYMVGSQSLKQQLCERGVPAYKIYTTGIPVRAEFKNKHPFYGASKKHLLIMGGGLGLIPKDLDFYNQLNQCEDMYTTIILGNNRELYDLLHGRYENIEVIGYTDRVCEYMEMADVLLSKPGGITMFETIHCQLPILTIHPFLQQEIKNAKFIEEQGLGHVIWDKKSNPVVEIEAFLNDYKKLEEIKENMSQFHDALVEDGLQQILTQVTRKQIAAFVPRSIEIPRKGVAV